MLVDTVGFDDKFLPLPEFNIPKYLFRVQLLEVMFQSSIFENIVSSSLLENIASSSMFEDVSSSSILEILFSRLFESNVYKFNL